MTNPHSFRVLRIIARLNMGGPARHAVLLDRGLRQRGWETLLVHGSLGPAEGSLEHLVAEYQVSSHRVSELGRRVHPFSDLVALVRIGRIVMRYRPDVIHTHTAKAGALGRACGIVYNLLHRRRHRILLVHTFHGHVLSGYFGRWGTLVVRLLERLLALGTHRVIAISPSQREDLAERFRVVSPSQVAVVPLGLELGPFFESGPSVSARALLGLDPDDFVIGFVGRFVPIKNLSTLLHAFRRVLAAVPRAKLALAGDGELRSDLEDLAAALGISAHVRFVGWQRDLTIVYSAFDVAALSSLNEGTPVMLLEAMAAGVPVVATRVGGVRDIVDNGATGLLVESGDADALAGAIVCLASDLPLRTRIAAQARASVRTRFESSRLVADVDSLYREALTELRTPLAAAAGRVSC